MWPCFKDLTDAHVEMSPGQLNKLNTHMLKATSSRANSQQRFKEHSTSLCPYCPQRGGDGRMSTPKVDSLRLSFHEHEGPSRNIQDINYVQLYFHEYVLHEYEVNEEILHYYIYKNV